MGVEQSRCVESDLDSVLDNQFFFLAFHHLVSICRWPKTYINHYYFFLLGVPTIEWIKKRETKKVFEMVEWA